MIGKSILPLVLLSLSLLAPAPAAQAWKFAHGAMELVSNPVVAGLAPAIEEADLDHDSQPENLTISPDGKAAIYSGKNLRWNSPPTWQVRQGSMADLNQDGLLEAVLLVWRPFKPWPVDSWLPKNGRINNFHNQDGLSCHLILIGWSKEQNAFLERWAGSALAEPVLSLATGDLSGEGKQMLVTLEGSYDAAASLPASQLKIWEWNGFGFSLVARQAGQFSRLFIASSSTGQTLILTP